MPEALQVSNAGNALGAPGPQRGRLRNAIASAVDQIMGKTGAPLEAEYNPLQAGMIAAGAATDSGINQAKRAFQHGAGYVASLSRNPAMQAEAQRMRGLAEQTGQQMQEADAIYQPLREAFPYSAAIGEAIPTAAVPGRAPVFESNALLNVSREYLDELARATKNPYIAALVEGLRKF